jgi:serine/threonine-protein kinase
MSEPPDRLLSLATAIADGTPVDWPRPEAGDEGERRLIEALRVIARLKELHASESDDLPRRWGAIEILDLLGAGGFGRVYRGRDTVLDREVALKLRPADAGSAEAALREARLLARVHHPSVVVVHGADYRDGQVGIWMERVRGRTLHEVVRERGPLDARQAARIGIDLCRALRAVHAAGLVHRDVKAGNVMLDDAGRVVLMDIGAGRLIEDDVAAAGTPLYMAPELLRGRPATPQSDLYAVGVLLYHLTTGAHPVEGSSVAELRAAHREGRRTPLGSRRPDLRRRFVSLVERALEDSPERRYRSAAAMESALLGWVASRRRRRRLGAAAAVLAALALAWVLRPAEPASLGLTREAQVREALGAFDDARRLYERLLELEEQRHGPDHLEVAHALVRLAHVREALGDRAAAVALYTRALAIYESRLGRDHPAASATRKEVAAPAADRAERGDPFVRPLDVERRLGEPEPASPAESPLYRIEAGLVESDGKSRLRIEASEPLFVYVLNETESGSFDLVFPLPGSRPANPLPPAAVHHVPVTVGPLVVVASPSRLAEFEAELARLRVPGAGSLDRVPLSRSTLRALHSAFGDPSALARARPVSGHPEIVRGLWVRRAGEAPARLDVSPGPR